MLYTLHTQWNKQVLTRLVSDLFVYYRLGYKPICFGLYINNIPIYKFCIFLNSKMRLYEKKKLLADYSQLIDLFWLHRDIFNRWWGKYQDFKLISLFNANGLIGCGGDP